MIKIAIINYSPNWLEMVENLEEYGYSTKIVMSTKTINSLIKRKKGLSFLDIQELSDGKKDIIKNQSYDFFSENRDLINEHLDIILRLSNRNMYLRKKKYHEIILYVQNLSNYLYEEFLKIDKYVFMTIPHQLSTYLVYIIAKSLNKTTIMLTPTNINYLYTLSKGITDQVTEKNIADIYEKDVLKLLNEYSIKVISETNFGENDPLSNQKKDTKFLMALINEFKRALYTLKIPKKYRNKINPINSIAIRFERLLKTKSLEKYYKKISVEPDFNLEYVYFPLHYQPERTTLPMGGIYNDLLLALRKVRSVVDKKIYIYVKEHPSTFYRRQGYYFRSKEFYNVIMSLSNVRLIKTSVPSRKLINSSHKTISVNGTAVIEAKLLEKKSYYMGFPWFRNLTELNFRNYKNRSEQYSQLIKTESDFFSLKDFLIYGIDSSDAYAYEKSKSKESTTKKESLLKNIIYYLSN